MYLLIFILYLVGSFFAFGQGIDTGKQNGDQIGGKIWALCTISLFLVLTLWR
jgi:hypothetical protein